MDWISPKTDWVATDYINIEDYNRWKNNIEFLSEFGNTLYVAFDIEPMGSDKTYSDYFYADEFNLLESNLRAISDYTYPFFSTAKTYFENRPIPDHVELNRIENAMLVMYQNMMGQSVGKRKISFRLGGSKI